MTLPDYRHGHILFVGDAAHMLPIFGVRGANTAFQDAQNLAWKLALVCQGKAAPELLGTYSQERVAAAREIIQEGGRSTRFMTPPSHGFRLMRNATLSLALQHDFVRPLFHWRTSRAHVYAESPINASSSPNGLSAEAGVGSVMPNVRLDDGSCLLDYLTPKFAVVICGGNGSINGEGLNALGELQNNMKAQGASFDIILLGSGAAGAGPARGGVLLLADSAANFKKTFWRNEADGPRVFLVRPDQHIAGCWSEPDAHCVAQIQRALGAYTLLH